MVVEERSVVVLVITLFVVVIIVVVSGTWSVGRDMEGMYDVMVFAGVGNGTVGRCFVMDVGKHAVNIEVGWSWSPRLGCCKLGKVFDDSGVVDICGVYHSEVVVDSDSGVSIVDDISRIQCDNDEGKMGKKVREKLDDSGEA